MRPFCIALLASILGIMIGLYLKSITLFFIIIVIINILLVFCKCKRKQIVIFGICFTLFWSYITFLENSYHQKYQEYGGKQVKIEAIIVSNKKETEYKETYQIKVVKIENVETRKKSNQSFQMICNVKKAKGSLINLKYGDKIEFLANYELPSVARNEAGFNYRQYLKTKKIVGIVNITNFEKVAENQANCLQTQIYLFKTNLIEKIKSILPKEEASLGIGLLLGDKSTISQEVQETFKKSSLSHMLAVSGAHVSYILLGINTFLSMVKLHKRWSKLLLIFFLIFFMALIEFTPSVTRACIMCILTLMADILFCKADIYQNLSISLLIILLFNPYSILDIGLKLSFVGTLGIVLFMQKKNGGKEAKKETTKIKYRIKKLLYRTKQIIKVSFAANLMILPIMLYHYNTMSATFLISNVLASPILGICLIMLLIFVVFILIFKPFAQIFSYLLVPVIQILMQITRVTSKLPLSQILVPTPKIWQIAIYYLLAFIFFYKNKKEQTIISFIIHNFYFSKKQLQNNFKKMQKIMQKAILIIGIILLLFPYSFQYVPSSYVSIHCIDVGQRR